MACSGNHLLVVLQDAPQHARRETKTLRVLREEAQHVVEERSVDDSMDGVEACEKDVGKDEEEGTCTAEVRQIPQRCLVGVVPEEDTAGDSRLLAVGIGDGESTVVGDRGVTLLLGCMVRMANAVEKVAAEKEVFPSAASSVPAAKLPESVYLCHAVGICVGW